MLNTITELKSGLLNVLAERTSMSLELLEKDGMIEYFQFTTKKLQNNINELEKQIRKQKRIIHQKETEEVMTLAGRSVDRDSVDKSESNNKLETRIRIGDKEQKSRLRDSQSLQSSIERPITHTSSVLIARMDS